MVQCVDEINEARENVKLDWHQFKYYKEKEYRSLENDFYKLRYDFKLLALGHGDQLLTDLDDI
jgi:hypothetical protein